MPLHPAKTLVDAPDPLADPDTWAKTSPKFLPIRPGRTDFLPRPKRWKEPAPGDPIILFQTAMAALLDRRPDKAQLYLKRYAKRYLASEPYHLLSALTLAAQKKLIAARALLERHRLTNWHWIGSFPGGWERRHWLAERRRHHGSRASDAQSRAGGQAHPVQGRPEKSFVDQIRRTAASTSTAGGSAGNIDLGAAAGRYSAGRQFGPRPLLAAATGQSESEGGWFILRERFAHLGLAEGFDEPLCVPHLEGIEMTRCRMLDGRLWWVLLKNSENERSRKSRFRA